MRRYVATLKLAGSTRGILEEDPKNTRRRLEEDPKKTRRRLEEERRFKGFRADALLERYARWRGFVLRTLFWGFR